LLSRQVFSRYLVDMSILTVTKCSDLVCTDSCITWTTTVGTCAEKSILLINAITLYSDTACQHPIPGAELMTLFLDTGCQVLYAGNDSKIGSYKASNTSAIIGGVATVVIFIIAVITICYYRNRAIKEQQIRPTIVVNPLI
jgi:hypothetical protein